MAPHHTLALKAMNYGVDKIPDKAFDKIPFAGPRFFKEKEDAGNDSGYGDSRGKQQGDDPDSRLNSDDEERQKHRPRRRRPRRRESRNADRGYESDRGTPTNMQYFPPPPTVPIDGQAGTSTGAYQHYDPSTYVGQERYRAGTPLSQQLHEQADHQQHPPSSNYDPDDSLYGSSVAHRYRPAGYAPMDDSYQRGSSPLQQQRLTYPTYQPPDPTAVAVRHTDENHPSHSGLDSPYDEEKMRHGRHRSDSTGDGRDHSRRSSKIREELKQHKDIGVSALGALAGGFLGNEFSRNHGKVGMLVGAAIGGIGANVMEKRHEKEKRSKEKPVRHRDYDYGYDSY